MDFLRICAIFCRYWTCSFSGRNNQAIGPRLSAIFSFFYIPILFAKWELRRNNQAIGAKVVCIFTFSQYNFLIRTPLIPFLPAA